MYLTLLHVARTFLGLLTLLACLGAGATAHAQHRAAALEASVHGSSFSVSAAPGMEAYASQALRVVEGAWPRIAEELGAPPEPAIVISIEYRFEDWFVREGVPSRPPEWAAGLAIPSRRTILLAPGNATWESTLEHELAHVAVAMAAGDGHVPAWFTEGIAVLTAEQWSIERATTLAQAAAFHDFRSLDRSFPAAKSSADLAYAQSFHFVRWCRARWGVEVFRDVLALQRERDIAFDDAFADVTGTLLTVAYDEWAEAARVRYRWAPALMGGSLLGFAMLILIVSGWRRALRRRQVAMRRLAASDGDQRRAEADDRTFGG